MLIARTGRTEIEPYVAWVVGCLDKGIEKIHVLARGQDNITLAKVIVFQLERIDIVRKTAESLFEILFNKRKVKAIWIPHEGIPPAIISDALKRLENQLWFLHF
jgi:hypothetical protein